jgi:hypothetical protein
MLSAIPKTPLHARLGREGRLDPLDHPEYGTNVLPLRMSRDSLSRGYARLMTDLYEPNAFFDRVDQLWLSGPLVAEPGWRRFAATHPAKRLHRQMRSWIEAGVLTARIMIQMHDRRLRKIYIRRLLTALRKRPDGVLLRLYAIRCVMHFHFSQLAQALQARDGPLINTY